MLIGVLQLELVIGDATTAGEKRKVLRSLKDRWHHHHNVSVAEVEYQDDPGRTLMAVVMVGTDARQLESSLSKIVDHLKNERYAELQDFQIEVIAGR